MRFLALIAVVLSGCAPSIISARVVDASDTLVESYAPEAQPRADIKLRAVVTALKPVTSVVVHFGDNGPVYNVPRMSDKVFEIDLSTLPEFDQHALANDDTLEFTIIATDLDGATTSSKPLRLPIEHAAH